MIKQIELLNKLSKDHKLWCHMIRSLGTSTNVEDIVQEMYLQMFKKRNIEKITLPDGDINKNYIFIVLRNIYFKEYNIKTHKSIQTCQLESWHSDGSLDEEYSDDFDILLDEINEEIDSWDWYHSKLFKTIFNTNMSQRELSRQTRIPFSSINNTINKCKLKLINKFGDKYNNLK